MVSGRWSRRSTHRGNLLFLCSSYRCHFPSNLAAALVAALGNHEGCPGGLLASLHHQRQLTMVWEIGIVLQPRYLERPELDLSGGQVLR